MMTKKYDKDEALAKIKVLMNEYFQNIGRDTFSDNNEARIELIDDIDEILSETDISEKHLIVEKLNLDENN